MQPEQPSNLWSHSSQRLWARKNCHTQLSKNYIPKCPGITWMPRKVLTWKNHGLAFDMLKQGPVTGSIAHGLLWTHSKTLPQASDSKRCLCSTAFHRYPTKFQVHCYWQECALHSSQLHVCTTHVQVLQPSLQIQVKADRQAEQRETCLQWEISYSSGGAHAYIHRHILGSSSLDPFLEETSKSQSHGPDPPNFKKV